LSLLGETQVNRLGHRRDLALFLHGSSPPANSYSRPCSSNRRAIYAFWLFSRVLANRLRVHTEPIVRNAVI
jgi:hypothetical protein